MVLQSIMRAIIKSFQQLVLKEFIARNYPHVNTIPSEFSEVKREKSRTLSLIQQHWEAGATNCWELLFTIRDYFRESVYFLDCEQAKEAFTI
ncbi:hypothetical protein Desti_4884 [Desulfomonile tiedjei DSM 6799]|uniref:Uncharacterized protein n=1 Tax=Desulfomonile tiedjei (strain ATCC 49306 / DSM 6799 / DCB-1) TaxID=706587 RepID=I4CD57_DESTA|nr:hypothetical protein Desti_4884 [Desulfomonile tiedjei DSM 6799]